MNDTEMAAAIGAITEPAAPDNTGLLETVRLIRQQIAEAKADPKNLAFNRPDIIAQMEQNCAVALARSGATEPVFNPHQAALDAHDASFSLGDLNENLADMLDDRLEQMAEQYSEAGLTRLAAELRHRTGAAVYDRMVAEAKSALNPGETLHPAALADMTTLNLLAAHGRRNFHYERTKPKL